MTLSDSVLQHAVVFVLISHAVEGVKQAFAKAV